MDPLLLKQSLYHGSWLVLPCVAWLLWRLRRREGRWLCVALLAACLVFAWARFVEPQWIRVQETTLAGTGLHADIALVSDIHLGVYKDRRFLERLVERLQALPVDAIAIAGDLTYEPGEASLEAMFAPLAALDRPLYVVLGNHDPQAPGPDIDAALRRALVAHGARVIEGQIVDSGAGYRWAGLGDRWAGRDDPGVLHASPSPLPTLVLAHQPDSAAGLRPGAASLLLAGHTHGGQIRIPWLYRMVIPSRMGFDRGERHLAVPGGEVRTFTTAGVGEIGLPLRLFNPPTIDVLRLRP